MVGESSRILLRLLVRQSLGEVRDRQDGLGEDFVVEADVGLGRGDVGVAQQFLDGSEVLGGVVGGGGEPVAQLVGGVAGAE